MSTTDEKDEVRVLISHFEMDEGEEVPPTILARFGTDDDGAAVDINVTGIDEDDVPRILAFLEDILTEIRQTNEELPGEEVEDLHANLTEIENDDSEMIRPGDLVENRYRTELDKRVVVNVNGERGTITLLGPSGRESSPYPRENYRIVKRGEVER